MFPQVEPEEDSGPDQHDASLQDCKSRTKSLPLLRSPSRRRPLSSVPTIHLGGHGEVTGPDWRRSTHKDWRSFFLSHTQKDLAETTPTGQNRKFHLGETHVTAGTAGVSSAGPGTRLGTLLDHPSGPSTCTGSAAVLPLPCVSLLTLRTTNICAELLL